MTNITEPWDVDSKYFPVEKDQVLYYDNYDKCYALAVSHYNGKPPRKLGIRWFNSEHGFPRYHWMVVPDELAIPILKFIKENYKDGVNLVNHKNIDQAIEELAKNI